MGIKILKHAYENTKTNSLAFTKLLISWLRANGIKHRLYFQTDCETKIRWLIHKCMAKVTKRCI